MSLKHITIELYDEKVCITNEGQVQLYAGDRGSTVWSTVELTSEELSIYIDKLMAARNELNNGR